MAGQRRETLIDVESRTFERTLAKALEEMKLKGDADLKRKAIEVTNRAKQLCPVATGRLRAAIMTGPLDKDRTGSYIDVGVSNGRLGSDAEVTYAPYVEYGTSYMRVQPFIRPALAEASGGDFPMKQDTAAAPDEAA